MIYVEIFLVLLIFVLQITLFTQNRDQAWKVADFFPEQANLDLKQEMVEPEEGDFEKAYPVKQLLARRPSASFKNVVKETNVYLLKNKGSAASFDMLKEIAQRRYKLQAKASGATISYPLYLGFLGALLLMGMALGQLVQKGMSEAGVQAFLIATILALVAVFVGLLLALLSRFQYRKARQQAAIRKQEYFSFLQLELLPTLQQDMAVSLSNLRTVLDQFNKGFFQKIIDFKEVFMTLGNYVGIQEKLLSSLEKVGFTEITAANLHFLDKVRENESLFEAFGSYQRRLNESLELGAEAARDIRQVVERLRQIDDVQAYIRQNEEMIRRQLGYLSAHEDRMQDLTQSIQQHFIEAGDEMGKIVQERLQNLKKQEQDAGEALQAHFARLQQENVYQKLADQLQPIQQMKLQVDELSRNTEESSRMLLQTSEYIVKKIKQDSRMHHLLMEEMQELNRQMKQLNEPKSFWQQLTGKK